MSQVIASNTGFQTNAYTPTGTAPGASAPLPQLANGLPPEYGNSLFTNLQAKANATRNAQRQSVIDNSRNPAQAGAEQTNLRLADQNNADSALQNATNAELQGANAGAEDRRLYQTQMFNAQQADQQRLLQKYLGEAGLNFDYNQLAAQKEAANRKAVMDTTGGFMKMMG